MNELLKNLNPEQLEAVEHINGPLLIVAGAGTGKTTVITKKIAYLVTENYCKTDQILALTFTDKSAGEMEERVDRLMPYGYVDLWISTFHAFTERILRDHAHEIGLPSDFKVLSDTEQWLLVKNNLNLFELDYYKPLGNPTKFIHDLLKFFSRLKDEDIDPQTFADFANSLNQKEKRNALIDELFKDEDDLEGIDYERAVDEEIKKIREASIAYKIYQQLLLDNRAVDFGDMIFYCLRLFKTRQNVLLKYQKQFKYILVDEFQDTNFAQYQLVKMLASPQNNITVVGDDDQSIYKFRGASISNIMQFKDDFPQAKEIYLNQNYRSKQNILDLAYEFIQKNNPYRLEVKLATNGKLNKKLKAYQSGSGEIWHWQGQDQLDEVKMVVEKINEIRRLDPEIKWSDFAILLRANAAANNFIYTFDLLGIPYSFMASKGLYGKPIVLDLVAYLKILDQYHESASMYRVVNMPFFSVPKMDIAKVGHFAQKNSRSLYEALKEASNIPELSTIAQDKIAAMMALIIKHDLANDSRSATITEIIQLFLEDTGYLKQLISEDSSYSREQLSYLNQFYKKARKFEEDSNDKSVHNFLALLELELEAGDEGRLREDADLADYDTVKIMTIHGSKGLEFKHVFIPNMVDRCFPTTAKKDIIELPKQLVKEITPEGDFHLMEERRLFYVAMTRAKEGLYLTSAENYGGAQKKKISRFIAELNPQLIKSATIISDENKSIIPVKRIAKPVNDLPKQNFLPNRLSYTQITAYQNCPYQYRLAHIFHVPVKGKGQFSFGKTIHATLENFFKELIQNSNTDINRLLKIYEEQFVTENYADAEEQKKYREHGEKILKEFYLKNHLDWPKVKYLEYPFNVKFQSDEPYTLYGKIDRVDDIDGGKRLVDYKTGTVKKKLTFDDKEQLLLYALAYEQVTGEKVKELLQYYINENQPLVFEPKEKDLDKVREVVLKTVAGIKSGNFEPTPGRNCEYCDFKHICEFKDE